MIAFPVLRISGIQSGQRRQIQAEICPSISVNYEMTTDRNHASNRKPCVIGISNAQKITASLGSVPSTLPGVVWMEKGIIFKAAMIQA